MVRMYQSELGVVDEVSVEKVFSMLEKSRVCFAGGLLGSDEGEERVVVDDTVLDVGALGSQGRESSSSDIGGDGIGMERLYVL